MDYKQFRARRQVDLFTPEVHPKVIHAGERYVGQPYQYFGDSEIRISAGRTNGITIDDLFGVTIQGPISLSEMPENISIGGGYWRINPMVLTGVASSAATPVPWLVPSDPNLVKQKKNLKKILSQVEGL